MFFINCPDGKKEIPPTVTHTSKMIEFCINSTKNSNNIHSIMYNSVYINQKDNIPLVDIGYGPFEKIELKPMETKTIYFSLLSFDYTFSYQITSDYTCFNSKSYFAKKFYTVPQNIIIQNQHQNLKDDTYLFNLKNNEYSPFTVSVINDYNLFYCFFDHFNFVCLKNNSTLRNLRDIISIKHNIFNGFTYGERISKYFNNNGKKIDENSDLLALSKEVHFFDFICTPQKNKSVSFTVKSTIEQDNKIELKLTEPQTIYFFTCYLEQKYKIDRGLFKPYNEDGIEINLNSLITKDKNNQIIFKINSKLNVIIDNKMEKFSYLTTINDIKNIYHFNDKNFGIIINNHFVYEKGKAEYLINFLNNYDNEITEIILKRPAQPCHIFSFKKMNSKNYESFIVPDSFANKIDKIINFCLKQNVDSFQIKNNKKINNAFYFHLINANNRNINVTFIDESLKSIDMIVPLKRENPRIIDLFYVIRDKNKKIFKKKKNASLSAFLSNKELHPCKLLSEILYDSENKLTIKIYYNDQKSISIIDVKNRNEINLKYDDYSVKDIIKKITKQENLNEESEYALFLNYIKLNDDDHPLICNQCNELMFNEITDKKKLNFTNGSIYFNTTLHKKDFSIVPFLITSMFCLTDFNEEHLYRKRKWSEISIPTEFDAGVLLDDDEIIIDYKYVKSNKLTFMYQGKKKIISISDIDAPISEIKDEIQQKLRIFNAAANSLYFSFYDAKLDQSQSFSYYKFMENTIIRVNIAPNSYQINVSFGIYSSYDFNVLPSSSIQDIKFLIKQKFNYNDEFELHTEKNENLLPDHRLENNMTLKFIDKKKKIISQGSLNNTSFYMIGILKAGKAIPYLQKKFKCKLSLFTFNHNKKCYEKVDDNKRLYEIKEDLFVHKLFDLKCIKFGENNFSLNLTNQYISECNTIGWFLKNIIIKQNLINKEIVLISESGEMLNDNNQIWKSINEKTSLKFANEVPNIISKLQKIKTIDNDDVNMDNDIESNLYEEEKNEIPVHTYKFQIYDSDDIISLTLNDTAKICDLQKKIARDNKYEFPEKVSFIFAGCRLKESIKISSLNLYEDDIILVYIPETDDILLRTYTSLKDDEYSSYYSDDDYDESNDIKSVQSIKEKEINEEMKEDEKNTNDIELKFLSKDLINLIKPQLKIEKRLLGKGGSSFVYKVNCIDKTNEYNEECKNFLALKIIKKSFCEISHSVQPKALKEWDDDDDDDDDDNDTEENESKLQIDFKKIKKFFQEYECILRLQHPNIIKSFGFYQGDEINPPCILLEYFTHNLNNSILILEDVYLVSIIFEICVAMDFVHRHGLIHRDLKPANILLDQEKHVKICDFGIATLIPSDTNTTSQSSIFGGTRGFIAPELFLSRKCNEKVDVYSFGVVMHFILTRGEIPEINIVEAVINKKMILSSKINKISNDLICRCLSISPNERPSFYEIIKYIKENKMMLIDGIDDTNKTLYSHLRNSLK